MISVTHRKSGQTRVFKDDMLERICLEVAGGGWTAAQTKKGLVILHTLRDKGIFKNKDAIIEVKP